MDISNQPARRGQGFLRRDDFHLGYAIEGQGAPLLIPGSHIYYPRSFSRYLRQHRTLIFVDHRGFARCDRPLAPRDMQLDTILDDIEALRRHLDLGRCDVLGHSGHGYMALDYARRFPDHVGRVVLVGTGPSQAPAHMQAAQHAWETRAEPERRALLARDLPLMEADIRTAPERRFVWMCLGMAARSWYNPGYDARPLWDGVTTQMPIFDALWGETFAGYPIREALADISAPLLICMGRHDYLVAPAESWAPLLADAPGAQIAVFDRSGHTPQLEEPDAFDKRLLDFLS